MAYQASESCSSVTPAAASHLPHATCPWTLRKWEATAARTGCARVSAGVGGGADACVTRVLAGKSTTRTEATRSLQPQAWTPDQG